MESEILDENCSVLSPSFVLSLSPDLISDLVVVIVPGGKVSLSVQCFSLSAQEGGSFRVEERKRSVFCKKCP